MNRLSTLSRRTVAFLSENRMTVSSAESCTGGLLAKSITDIAGSSAVFAGACVTYTNRVKQSLLGVESAILEAYTEVSEPCAKAMAEGVRRRLGTSIGVSTTGYAGPGGGTEQDPVGTVYIAVASDRGTVCERFCAPAGSTRSQVRTLAACRALELVLDCW